jgi:hypothetical protein
MRFLFGCKFCGIVLREAQIVERPELPVWSNGVMYWCHLFGHLRGSISSRVFQFKVFCIARSGETLNVPMVCEMSNVGVQTRK